MTIESWQTRICQLFFGVESENGIGLIYNRYPIRNNWHQATFWPRSSVRLFAHRRLVCAHGCVYARRSSKIYWFWKNWSTGTPLIVWVEILNRWCTNLSSICLSQISSNRSLRVLAEKKRIILCYRAFQAYYSQSSAMDSVGLIHEN